MGQYKELVDKQRKFFEEGNTLQYEFRKSCLNLLSKIIFDNQDEIVKALAKDFDKPEFETFETEIFPVLRELDFMIKNLKKLMKPKKQRIYMSAFPGKGYIYHEPFGVSIIISPWNYPFLLTIMPLIGAIAAGNTAVVVPAIHSKATSKLIEKMISEVFEEDFIKVLAEDKYITEEILEERFDKIFLTSGPSVAKTVMKKAAKHLTPVTLELGGKSPVIVYNTKHIKNAAEKIVWGKFINAGQTCVAPDYVLVDNKIKQELIKEMIITIKEFYGDNPIDNKDYASIIHKDAFDRFLDILSKEEIAHGGGYDEERLRIEPTIVNSPSLFSALLHEEIFGPILPIVGVDSIDEALDFICKREKPLALYLFTENKEVEKLVLEKAHFGGGCVNDTVLHLASGMPFGGVGESGMGQYLGKESFYTFSNKKSILKKRIRYKLTMIMPPYTKEKLNLLKKLFSA